MNRTEYRALVALGIASNVVQFVDFASKLVSRISEYSTAAGGVPKKLQELQARLGLVDETLNSLTTDSLVSVGQEEQTISLCVNQVQDLSMLLEKVELRWRTSSSASISWAGRQLDRMELTWKASKSLRGQEKIKDLQKSLDRLLALLTLRLQIKSNTALEQLRLTMNRADEGPRQLRLKHTIPFLRNLNFVARKGLTDSIEQRFTSGEPKVVLYGLGGAGKTQIALEYAFRTSQAHSVFWVYASSDTNFKESYQRIANVCEIPSRRDPQANIMRLVHDWLESPEAHKW